MKKRTLFTSLLLTTALTATPALADDTGPQHKHEAEHDDATRVVRVRHGKGKHQVVVIKRRAFLGVKLMDLTPELRVHYGAGKDAGALIAHVEPGSPAAKAGVQVGDVLVAVEGDKVDSSFEAARLVGKRKGGDKAKLTVLRAGKRKILTATLEERDRPQVEVRKLVRRLRMGDEGDVDIDVDIDLEPLEEALQQLEVSLEDLDEDKLRQIEQRSHAVDEEERKLKQRLEQMEKRMEKLERELEKMER